MLDTESLEEVVGFSHRKEEISDIKFSPGLYYVGAQVFTPQSYSISIFYFIDLIFFSSNLQVFGCGVS